MTSNFTYDLRTKLLDLDDLCSHYVAATTGKRINHKRSIPRLYRFICIGVYKYVMTSYAVLQILFVSAVKK